MASGEERRGEEPEPTMGDILDRAGRRVTTGLVIAGGLIGLGLYSQPGPQRYQAFEVAGQVVRVDTKSGSMIACDGVSCNSIHRQGRKIDRKAKKLVADPAPAAALPAPAPQPATAAPPTERR